MGILIEDKIVHWYKIQRACVNPKDRTSDGCDAFKWYDMPDLSQYQWREDSESRMKAYNMLAKLRRLNRNAQFEVPMHFRIIRIPVRRQYIINK